MNIILLHMNNGNEMANKLKYDMITRWGWCEYQYEMERCSAWKKVEQINEYLFIEI